jgi:hypothetical protein
MPLFSLVLLLLSVTAASAKKGASLSDEELQWMKRQRAQRDAAGADTAVPDGARQAMAAADDIDKMLSSLESELKSKDAAAAAAKSIAATAAALGGGGSAANAAAAAAGRAARPSTSASSTQSSASSPATLTVVEPPANAAAAVDTVVVGGSAVVELNMRNFDDYVAKINDGVAVFVQFYADW